MPLGTNETGNRQEGEGKVKMLGGGLMCHWVQKRQVSLTCTLNYLQFSLTFCWLPSVLLPVFLECLT